jgi:serine-type D-Ala-D-Ala carboxypeptidase (penicillin-binding protein 5/6)
MRRSLAAVVAALACLAVGTSPAWAAKSGIDPVGGPLLAGHGVIVRPLSGAPALPTDLTSASWLVADVDTGQVLAAKAPHERFLPASTLKTLTAVTLIPRLDPNQLAKPGYRDVAVTGSKVGLVQGMSYTVRQLFTAMLVVSGNDAADTLAEAAGGIGKTVRMMNAEATHLQAYDTFARTPSGLDGPGESSSAYDLALIARAGLAMPDFRKYVGTVKSRMPAPHHKHFQIYTHNRLLTTYRGDIGIKNGYTVAANATYVGAATRHGHTIVITLMHANPYFWPEAKSLLDWGFKAEGKVEPIGTLVDPQQAAPVTAKAPKSDTSSTTLVLSARHNGGSVPVWQIALLAASAAIAAVVTARRLRRPARLSLPPL